MRLPRRRIHRAFPELDGLSDAEGVAFVRQCMGLHPFGAFGAWAAAVALGVLGVVTGVRAALLGVESGQVAFLAVMAVGLAAAGFLGGLWVRDVWMRALVARHLGDIRCLRCRYVLLGLLLEQGTVVCPECGLVRRLYVQPPAVSSRAEQPAPTPEAARARPASGAELAGLVGQRARGWRARDPGGPAA